MGTGADVYERHKLCADLVFGQLCFRAMKYDEGKFEQVCHEHVPVSRITEERTFEALRSLISRFSEWPANFIVNSLLNRRGRKPECYPGFTHHTTYPEPGAIRQYVSSSQVHAWCDRVLSKDKFRRPVATSGRGKA